jgi:hypothetical protein
MIRRVFVEDQEKVRTHHTPFSIEDLKSAVQEGRESERERIIGLLEKADIYERPVVIERDLLIALISGDKKT